MLRSRTIAAAPVRSASVTWQTITDLVADTVAVSASCTRAEAEEAMKIAAPAGRILIAGGHLDHLPVVLVAGTVHCQITTVSGEAALRAEENLNVIPGAATATTFTVHLPAPEPLTSMIAEVVTCHPRLSMSEAAPTQGWASSGPSAIPLIDVQALRGAVTSR